MKIPEGITTDVIPRIVRWLDDDRPGWAQQIDLDVFDMADPKRCVFGQLYGSFTAGLRRFRIGWSSSSANWSNELRAMLPTYAAEWVSIIRTRQDGRVS